MIGVGQVKEVTANDKNNLGTDISDLDDVARGIAGIDLGPVVRDSYNRFPVCPYLMFSAL